MGCRLVRSGRFWWAPIVILFIIGGPVNAKGMFGIAVPGLTDDCRQSPCPNLAAPIVYVGWMEDGEGTTFSAYATGATSGGVILRYPNRGLWFGLSESVCLSRSLSFTASGWYLFASRTSGREFYDLGEAGFVFVPPAERSWDTDTQWWFVDGLFAIGSRQGFSVLAGVRYDYYTSRLKNSFNASAPLLPTYRGNVILRNWIPLVGAECSYNGSSSGLTVRAVGFPALLGSYNFADVDTADSVVSNGSWTRGYFLEVLAEYSRNVGPVSTGVFARWNSTHESSQEDTIAIGALEHFHRSPHDVATNRSSWTVGGAITLNFNEPW
jgi:hypothetical protein